MLKCRFKSIVGLLEDNECYDWGQCKGNNIPLNSKHSKGMRIKEFCLSYPFPAPYAPSISTTIIRTFQNRESKISTKSATNQLYHIKRMRGAWPHQAASTCVGALAIWAFHWFILINKHNQMKIRTHLDLHGWEWVSNQVNEEEKMNLFQRILRKQAWCPAFQVVYFNIPTRW